MWMMIFVSYGRKKGGSAEIKIFFFCLSILHRAKKGRNYAMPHCDFMNQGQTMERINCDSFSSVLHQHVETFFWNETIKVLLLQMYCHKFSSISPLPTEHTCYNKLNTQLK